MTTNESSPSLVSPLGRIKTWGWSSLFRHDALHPYERLAVLLWAALLVGVTLRVAIARPNSGSVFNVYTDAAVNWVEGQPLYTLDFSRTCYRYPPLIAVSFVPWTALPDKVAGILWRWLGVALLLAGMLVWVRRMGGNLSPARRGLFFALVVPLAMPSVNNAQANVHLLGLLLLGLWAVREERWTLAAALIAAATLFKLYPIAIGLLVMVAYPRQFGWRFLGLLAVGLVLPFLAQRPDYVAGQYELWFQYLHGDDRHTASIEQTTRDLHLLLRVWFVSPPEWLYQFLQAGSAVGIALLCWRLARASCPKSILLPLILNLGCVWMTLLGPSTESCTYTMLGPTIAGLLLLPTCPRSKFAHWTLLVGYGLLVVPVLAVAFPEGKRLQLWGPQPLGALLILGVILAEQMRKHIAAEGGKSAAQTHQ